MNKKAFSLIEVLVVVAIFSVISILVGRALVSSLTGSRKIDNAVSLRENLEYALSQFEREIRPAKEIVNCTVDSLTYLNSENVEKIFSCPAILPTYVSLDGERLTSDTIDVTDCVFSCTLESGSLSLSGQTKGTRESEESIITVFTTAKIRSY